MPVPRLYYIHRWIKLIAVTGFLQVFGQGIAFLGGITVTRLLSLNEYALYTLVVSILNILIELTDAGTYIGVMRQGGKVWENPKKLGVILATGVELQKKVSYVSLPVGLAVLVYLLNKYYVSELMACITILGIVLALYSSLSFLLFGIPLKLNKDVKWLQYNLIEFNTVRLILLISVLFFYPSTAFAIACVGVSQCWASIRLHHLTKKYVDSTSKPDKIVEKELFSAFKKIMPSSIYSCFSCHFPVWILSFFGSTTSVAQFGALSRLGVLFSVFFSIFSILIVPVFSKIAVERKALFIKRFLQVQFGVFILVLFASLIAWQFPHEILWLLGKKYEGLENYVLIAVISMCFPLISDSVTKICQVRNYLINPVINIGFQFLIQLISIYLVDYSTTEGIFYYLILCWSMSYLFWVSLILLGIFDLIPSNSVKSAECKATLRL